MGPGKEPSPSLQLRVWVKRWVAVPGTAGGLAEDEVGASPAQDPRPALEHIEGLEEWKIQSGPGPRSGQRAPWRPGVADKLQAPGALRPLLGTSHWRPAPQNHSRLTTKGVQLGKAEPGFEPRAVHLKRPWHIINSPPSGPQSVCLDHTCVYPGLRTALPTASCWPDLQRGAQDGGSA